jgi:hypothetical protein
VRDLPNLGASAAREDDAQTNEQLMDFLFGS